MKVMPNPTPGKIIWILMTAFLVLVIVCYQLARPIGHLGGNWADVEVYEPYRGKGSFAPFEKDQAPIVGSMPRLEVDERSYIQRYVDDEGGELYTYGWVDRSKGIVRIPIYRAMERIVSEGLPHRKGQP
jgi:hypothetical protein